VLGGPSDKEGAHYVEEAMVPDWVGTSLVRTFRGDSSGQSILTRQVPGETDVLVWRRMVDYAARCGAGSWPQTAFWAITPVMSRPRQLGEKALLVAVIPRLPGHKPFNQTRAWYGHSQELNRDALYPLR